MQQMDSIFDKSGNTFLDLMIVLQPLALRIALTITDETLALSISGEKWHVILKFLLLFSMKRYLES
jgi:hypothetical protein